MELNGAAMHRSVQSMEELSGGRDEPSNLLSLHGNGTGGKWNDTCSDASPALGWSWPSLHT